MVETLFFFRLFCLSRCCEYCDSWESRPICTLNLAINFDFVKFRLGVGSFKSVWEVFYRILIIDFALLSPKFTDFPTVKHAAASSLSGVFSRVIQAEVRVSCPMTGMRAVTIKQVTYYFVERRHGWNTCSTELVRDTHPWLIESIRSRDRTASDTAMKKTTKPCDVTFSRSLPFGVTHIHFPSES